MKNNCSGNNEIIFKTKKEKKKKKGKHKTDRQGNIC